MNDIESRFNSKCDFLTIYLKEAHAKGGWEAPDQPFVVDEATSTQERHTTAQKFFAKVGLHGQHAVDSIDNNALLLFDALPDRILVIDKDHRFIHIQGSGPFGYQPPQLAEFLEATFGK